MAAFLGVHFFRKRRGTLSGQHVHVRAAVPDTPRQGRLLSGFMASKAGAQNGVGRLVSLERFPFGSILLAETGAYAAKLQNRRLSVTTPDNWIRRPFDDDFMTRFSRMGL